MLEPSNDSPPDADLSEGKLGQRDLWLANLGLEEHAHRIGQQKTVANAAISLAVVLYIAAMTFGGVLLYILATSPNPGSMHWHASLIVAAFVVPPTVLIVAVLRGAYKTEPGAKDTAPILDLFKEAAKILRDVFKVDKG